MTSLEHALLASYGVLASGLYRSYGWQLAAVAGVAAILPDWDGLTILWSVTLFDTAHRCWGHGLLSCLILSILLATLDCRFDFITRSAGFLIRLLRVQVSPEVCLLRQKPRWKEYLIWNAVVFAAFLSHLFADMIVSGAQGLSDWEIKIFYPFSSVGWVCPLIPWGDVGVLIIFIIGIFVMLWLKKRLQTIAILVLILTTLYALLRMG